MRRWASDLARANRGTFDSGAWSMAGHGVVVEHDDLDEIRELMPDVARDGGLVLSIVEREAVGGGFESWMDSIPEGTPTLIYLEPGRWVGTADDDEQVLPPEPTHDEAMAYGFRATLAKFMDSALRELPVVLVTVLQSFRQLDPLLRREGRFDRRVKLPRSSDEVLGKVFLQETGASVFDESLSAQPSRLGAVLRAEFRDSRRRSLLRQALRRRAWREGRPVGLADLVEFAVYGTGDEDEKAHTVDERWPAAVHEAGHALVGWLDSRDRVPPVYVSVTDRGGYLGIVVPPYDAHEQITDNRTRLDVVHEIRVRLAGRAAEHLILGADRTSARGSLCDFESASSLACDLLGRWGHAPEVESDLEASSNLAVVIGKPTASEYAHVETMLRGFLQAQFLWVLDLLRANQATLERIAQALASRGVLFQHELEDLKDAGRKIAA